MDLFRPCLNFKRVFAGAPELLSLLINAVRWNCPPITVVDIRNAEIVPEDLTQKLIVLDVLARDEAGRILNIEMQSRPHMGLPARLVFYLARLLVHELRAGEDYRQVSPVVGITLLDFDLFPVAEQALWAFELRDGQRPEVVLDRSLSLHMLELPKAERLAQAAPSKFSPLLADWITWFRHWNEDNIMQQIQHPAVHKAHQRLHALSGDDAAWLQAVQREQALSMEATLRAQAEEEKAEAEARGQAMGQVIGQAALLLRLLRARFGELPQAVENRLQAADTSQLEHWAERVLTAKTLEQVFSKH